jgi:folate-dependent phosphoribosylglycinamide formyltransferase PurN
MSGARRDRLLIFGDPNLSFSRVLLAAYLHELRSREDMDVVAVCDTARRAPLAEPWLSSVAWLRYLARRVFNSSLRGQRAPAFGRHLYGIARRSGVPVIVPPERNVNHPEFIARLRSDWRPTLALSLGCLQIFKPSLLDTFQMAVNYHDGYLPFYKGLAATAWSLYHRESHTGYSYHLIGRGIDRGPVLVQDRIPVRPGDTPSRFHREKTRLAARDAKRVLDLMAARSTGTPQRESGSYFSAADRRRICTIDDPTQLSSEEIQHRLRCFEILSLRIGGRLCEVTELTNATSRQSFTTEDGVTLAPHRMLWLPPWLYRLYSRLRQAID